MHKGQLYHSVTADKVTDWHRAVPTRPTISALRAGSSSLSFTHSRPDRHSDWPLSPHSCSSHLVLSKEAISLSVCLSECLFPPDAHGSILLSVAVPYSTVPYSNDVNSVLFFRVFMLCLSLWRCELVSISIYLCIWIIISYLSHNLKSTTNGSCSQTLAMCYIKIFLSFCFCMASQ